MAMLNAAGVKAMPVLISTRGHGRVDPELPFLNQYNRSLVLVMLGKKLDVLDTSDRFTSMGHLPFSSLFDRGLVIQKNAPQFIRNPNGGLKSQESVQCEVHVEPSGTVLGSAQVQSTGYACRNHNCALQTSKSVEDFLADEFGANLENLELAGTDTTLKAVATDPFQTKFDFKLENFAEVIDDEIFMRPAFFKCKQKNDFAAEKRVFPIEFGYRSKSTELNTIHVPAGFKIVELPGSKVIRNKYFKYTRSVTNLDDRLSYLRIFEVTDYFVPAADYARVRRDFARIVDADQEQVVFRNAGTN